MPRFLPTVASAGLLAAALIASPALAGDPVELDVAREAKMHRAVKVRKDDMSAVNPLPRVGVRGARNAGWLLSRLDVFASGREVTLRRLGSAYDVEGGASLYLLHNLSLAGGYRLTGYNLRAGDPPDLDEEHGGPFISLRFSY